ncbi:MAG: hypothetical protein WCG75_05210 [Armatimonadota bacterium]
MVLLVACVALLSAQKGFDWATSGETGPLRDFNMTAKFTSAAIPFEGPVPENADVKIAKGGRAYARINVEFYVQQYGAGTEIWKSECGNICQGPPPAHASHENCDRFCDRPCEATHHFEGLAHEGFFGWSLPSVEHPFTEAFADAAKMFKNRGLAVDDNMDWLTEIRDDYISKANGKADKEMFVYDPKHMGQDPYEPCLAGSFSVSALPERVVAVVKKDLVFEEKQGTQFKIVAEVQMGNDALIPVTSGSSGLAIGIKYFGIRCLCGTQTSMRYEGLPGIGIGSKWRSFPISSPSSGYDALAKNMTWGMVHVTSQGESMNNCLISVSGDPMARVHIPAGTMMVPDDKKAQVMMLLDDYDSSLSAGPGGLATQVRTACTEMTKAEPSPNTKFAIASPNDGNLSRLAEFTKKSRFRGPWDQVRVWIYTEGATYAEMEKKLVPMVSKPTYLMELDRVLAGGISSAKRKKLTAAISLDMISDFRCRVEGLTRALPVVWTSNSKKFLDTVPKYAEGWLKESEAQGPEMVATLTHFIGIKKLPEARATARKILLSVPESLRMKVANSGGLEAVSAGVFSANKAEVKATVEVLKAFAPTLYAKSIALGESRM